MHYKIAKIFSNLEYDLQYRFPLYMDGSHPVIEWLHENGLRNKILYDTQKFSRMLKRRKTVNFMTIYNEWYDLFVEILYLFDISKRGAYYLWEYGAVAAYNIVNEKFDDDDDMTSDNLCAKMIDLLDCHYDKWSIDALFEANYIFNQLNDCVIAESNTVYKNR